MASEKCTYCDSLHECLLTEQRYGDGLKAAAKAAADRFEERIKELERKVRILEDRTIGLARCR